MKTAMMTSAIVAATMVCGEGGRVYAAGNEPYLIGLIAGTTGAYGPQYRMPWPLRWLLTCCPKLLRRLLRLA